MKKQSTLTLLLLSALLLLVDSVAGLSVWCAGTLSASVLSVLFAAWWPVEGPQDRTARNSAIFGAVVPLAAVIFRWFILGWSEGPFTGPDIDHFTRALPGVLKILADIACGSWQMVCWHRLRYGGDPQDDGL